MSRVLLLHGEDDYNIEQAMGETVREFRAQPNAEYNLSEFEGAAASISEVIGAASALPFLASSRLVLVRGLLAHLARKGGGETARRAQEQLVEALPGLPDSTLLLLVERGKLPDSNRVLKAVPAQSVRVFAPPSDSTEWIVRQAKARGGQIDREAARALALATMNDLRLASNELDKLLAYTEGQRPITEADIALLTPYVAEARVFDMTDALGQGRGAAAARLAHQLLGQDQDVFQLFAMVNRQFRLLLLAREHLDGGGSRERSTLAQVLGVPPFLADKLAVQSRAFSLRQLEGIYRALHDADVKIKTGRIAPELALDLLIASLSQR